MQKKRWLRVVSGAAALLLVVAAVAWVVAPDQATPAQAGRGPNAASAAQGVARGAAQDDKGPVDNRVMVILPDKVDVSPPLRDIEPIVPMKAEETLIRWNETALRSGKGSFDGVDAGLQTVEGITAMPAPTVNFAGVSNVDGVLPPDTQGDVGPNHYVQWVNLSYGIWNKSGTQVVAATNGNTLWSGFDTICANNNDGDPITIYDHLADRWMMSQFQVNSGAASYQCIAVSVTGDPTGSWYRYRYTWPSYSGNYLMNDYPHFGLWPDAYYMTANQFVYSTGAWMGAGVAAFEREKMLTGATAQMVYFNLYPLDSGYGGQLPADWDGTTQPPSGAPGLIVEWDDSSWMGTNDALRIWKFHVDWTTPGNSTLGTGSAGTAGGPNWTINTNNVDPEVCTNYTRNCIDQPGTAVGLDAISDRLMHRVQYRNFGSYQTLVGNHTVDTNNPAGIAGIHWFELRNTGTAWAMHQQGTYAPADSASRWMGSIAMDASGNMALGYSLSSSSIYPSIRYVGRLANDTLGAMGQSETTLIAGSGYQSHNAYRWGDYSAMQVDPVDDCTFWYTQEYIATSGSANWVTRIGAFKFPSCSLAPDFTLGATPTTQDVCTGANAAYTVNLTSVGGFSAPVILTASGVPAGATATFSPNPVTPTGSSTLTIATGAAAAGSYTIGVIGTSGSLSHSTNVTLNVAAPLAAGPMLTAPLDGSTGGSTTPTLTWSAVAGATSYDIQVASDPAFTNIVASATGLTTTSYTPGSALTGDTVYYWRVYAVNSCGSSSASFTFAFRTGAGSTCTDIISNGGFESGRNVSWSESTGRNRDIVVDVTGARTGSWYARLGGANNENAQVWQTAPTISASATSATLTYWYQILSTDVCNYDYGYLKVAGTTRTTYNLCSSTAMSAYAQATYDMAAFKGTAPEVRFQATTDGSLTSTLRVDDVVLNVCTAGASTTADYSDLASSYGAAWHTGAGAVRLGGTLDWDTDDAFTTGSDDSTDNGVTRTAFTTSDGGVNLTVTGGTGYVTGWFDWNQDGDFSDAGEQVFANQAVSGTAAKSFSTNGNSVYGKTINARFRVYATAQTAAPEAAPQAWGGIDNGEVEDYTWYFSPLAVELAGFSATASAEGVTLAWETVSEVENAGFNVYRAAGGSVGDRPQQGVHPELVEGWVKLNETLIPAATPGSAQGNVYTWTDATVPAGTTWYVLEDVDLNGTATQHEPVSVTVVEPNAVSMTNFGAAGTALPALAGLGALALAALAGVAARKRR